MADLKLNSALSCVSLQEMKRSVTHFIALIMLDPVEWEEGTLPRATQWLCLALVFVNIFYFEDICEDAGSFLQLLVFSSYRTLN